MQSLVELIKTLGPQRIGAMGIVAAVLIGFFALVIARVTSPVMEPLFTDLTVKDSLEIVRLLEAQNVVHELSNEGSTVLVPQELAPRLRMTMAGEGLPSGGIAGYELFDSGDTLGATNFVQNINRLRALEGELARSIRSLDRVTAARVHLVIPERQLFQRDERDPSASIMVRVRGTLDGSQIRAIQHLVASAVDGLSPRRISIVDESGQLLAAAGDETALGGIALSIDERTSSIERRYRNQLTEIVSSIVGEGRARVQVTAELDFKRTTQVQDVFDPEGQIVRSTQTRSEITQAQTAEADGGVTVGNEIPNEGANGGGPNAQSTENSEITEETTNFDISKTQRTEVTEAGGLKRLSVAILIDGTYTENEDGTYTYNPRSEEELAQITALVESAIGYNEDRGDIVRVINQEFAQRPNFDASLLEEPGLFDFTQRDLMRLAELGVLGIVTIFVMLLIVRPLMKRIFAEDEKPTQEVDGVIENRDGVFVRVMEDGTEVVVDASELSEQEVQKTAIDTAMASGAIQNDSVRRVGELVNENPDEAVKIVRAWLLDAA